MSQKPRYSSAFKVRVTIEALREDKTMDEIADEFGVAKSQVSRWKAHVLQHMVGLFERSDSDSYRRKQAIAGIEKDLNVLKGLESE
jgi:putative transposase